MNPKNKFIYLFILIFLISYPTIGQFSTDKQSIKYIKNIHQHDFFLFPLNNKRLLLLNSSVKGGLVSKKVWEVVIKNESLETTFKKEISLPSAFNNEHFYFYDEADNFYILSEDEFKNKYHVLKIDAQKKEAKYFVGKSPVRFALKDIIALDDNVFLTGKSNNRHVVLDFNLIDSKITVLPSFYNEKEELEDFYIDRKYKKIYFTISNRQGKFCSMYIKPYSNIFGFSPNILVQKGQYKEQSPKWAYVYSQTPKDKLVFGTYSKNCSKFSQGIFVSNYKNNEETRMRYYKFSELSNFFSRFKDKKAKKLRQKVIKKRENGKDFHISHYTLPSSQITLNNGQIIMGFEGYAASDNSSLQVPYYQSMQMRNYPYRSGNFPTTVRQNNSYRYYYGLICAFDTTGKLLWDNIITYNTLEEGELKRHLEIGTLKDSTILAYKNGNKLFSKMVHKRKEIRPLKEQKVKDVLPNEKVHLLDKDNMFHWYDNYFILWGLQTTKVNYTDFFHITKLKYYPEQDVEEEVSDKKKKDKR